MAALLPTLLTIAILVWAYNLIDRNIGQYISAGFVTVLARSVGPPSAAVIRPTEDAIRYGTRIPEWDNEQGRWLTEEYKFLAYLRQHPSDSRRVERAVVLWRLAFAKYHLHLVGFVIAIVLVYFVGFSLASFYGRTTFRLIERLQSRIPLVKAVYPYVKQLTEFVFGEKKIEFTLVVAVEYPRKGIHSIGLVTGAGLRPLQAMAPQELVTVFVPSSPTPFTGYVITIPRSDVLELPLTIDEAVRFVVSGGVIQPDSGLMERSVPGPRHAIVRAEVGRPGSGAGGDAGGM
jgi:uncharacterized membrane protein